MKIKPQKTKKLPKYAAALAMLASAAVLTGCHSDDTALGGATVVCTDNSASDTPLQTDTPQAGSQVGSADSQ